MLADKRLVEPLFDKHHGQTLRRYALTQRKALNLENPYLPPHTPLANKDDWIDPSHWRQPH